MKNKRLGQMLSKSIAEGAQFVRNRYYKVTLWNPRQGSSHLTSHAHSVDMKIWEHCLDPHYSQWKEIDTKHYTGIIALKWTYKCLINVALDLYLCVRAMFHIQLKIKMEKCT